MSENTDGMVRQNPKKREKPVMKNLHSCSVQSVWFWFWFHQSSALVRKSKTETLWVWIHDRVIPTLTRLGSNHGNCKWNTWKQSHHLKTVFDHLALVFSWIIWHYLYWSSPLSPIITLLLLPTLIHSFLFGSILPLLKLSHHSCLLPTRL